MKSVVLVLKSRLKSIHPELFEQKNYPLQQAQNQNPCCENAQVKPRQAPFPADNQVFRLRARQVITGPDDLQQHQRNEQVAQQVNFVHQHHITRIGQSVAIRLLKKDRRKQSANGQRRACINVRRMQNECADADKHDDNNGQQHF